MVFRGKFAVISVAIAAIAPLFVSIPAQAATYGAPSAPQSISQSASASGVALSWSAPASGSPTNYLIERSTNGTTWTSVVTVSSATTSYTISSGLSPSTSYYFRIAALAGATQGAFGYPWTKIYGTTTSTRNDSGNIVYESGFGIAAGNAFSNANSNFSRVRYRLGTTISSVAKYADVDFYKWSTDKTTSSVSPSIDNLRIPSITGAANQFTVQADVTDLNVYSDNSMVTSGFGMDGRLEIWPWNYSQGTSALLPAGDAGTFDYDDSPATSGIYGSFQVHDLENLKPVFVWNRHYVGTTAEIAYGKNPTNHPDWTFCRDGQGTCTLPSSFSLQIYVNSPITTSAVITPANSAVPTISGTTTFGETLTSTAGSWSNTPTSYSYQWSRSASSGGTYTNISGATNSTYRLVAADVGQYLKSTVTASNVSGSASATSIATAQIADRSLNASLTLAPGSFIFRQAKNITAVTTVAGRITFRVGGKVLPGCKNKIVSAGNSFTTTCSYRPSNHSFVTISATLVPSDSFYTGTVTNSAQYLVTRRVGRR
jgi:hypothetical protein